MSCKACVAVTSLVFLSALGCKKGGPKTPEPAANVGPLGPITRITNRLATGLSRWVGGAELDQAFGGFEAKAAPGLLAKVREMGARGVRFIGMEFELLYHRGGRAEYYLRTFVHPASGGPVLLGFKGRKPRGGKLFVRGLGLSSFTGVASPFGVAASRYAALLAKGKCSSVPPAPLELMRSLSPPRLRDRAAGVAKRMRAELAASCGTFAALATAKVTLRIDDFSAQLLDGTGKPIGVLKGELEVKNGRLGVSLGAHRRYRRK